MSSSDSVLMAHSMINSFSSFCKSHHLKWFKIPDSCVVWLIIFFIREKKTFILEYFNIYNISVYSNTYLFFILKGKCVIHKLNAA